MTKNISKKQKILIIILIAVYCLPWKCIKLPVELSHIYYNGKIINTHYLLLEFKVLPVYIGAILFGPFTGVLIGSIGGMLDCILYSGFYGLLNILPLVIIGAVCGYLFRGKKIKIGLSFCLYIILLQVLYAILLIILNRYFYDINSKIQDINILIDEVCSGILYCIVISLLLLVFKN